VPWVIRSRPTRAIYQTVSVRALIDATFGVEPGTDYTSFSRDPEQPADLALLARDTEWSVSARSYRDP
jgi:hypothetical protein